MGKKCVCVCVTDKPFEESSEGEREEVRGKRMQEVVKNREVLTRPGKKVREEVEEMPKGIRKAPPTKFLPTMMGVHRQHSQTVWT